MNRYSTLLLEGSVHMECAGAVLLGLPLASGPSQPYSNPITSNPDPVFHAILHPCLHRSVNADELMCSDHRPVIAGYELQITPGRRGSDLAKSSCCVT